MCSHGVVGEGVARRRIVGVIVGVSVGWVAIHVLVVGVGVVAYRRAMDGWRGRAVVGGSGVGVLSLSEWPGLLLVVGHFGGLFPTEDAARSEDVLGGGAPLGGSVAADYWWGRRRLGRVSLFVLAGRGRRVHFGGWRTGSQKKWCGVGGRLGVGGKGGEVWWIENRQNRMQARQDAGRQGGVWQAG